jgi:hypothetical protein
MTRSITGYPEFNVQCSEIVMSVRVKFSEPFKAPARWDYASIIQRACESEVDSTSDLDAEVESYVPWVKLAPINIKIGDQKCVVDNVLITEYRWECHRLSRTPSQQGLERFALCRNFGMEITAILNPY